MTMSNGVEERSLANTVHIVDGSPESDAELDDVEDGVVGVGPVGAGLVQDGDLGVGQLPPEVEPGVRHWSQKVLNIIIFSERFFKKQQFGNSVFQYSLTIN